MADPNSGMQEGKFKARGWGRFFNKAFYRERDSCQTGAINYK